MERKDLRLAAYCIWFSVHYGDISVADFANAADPPANAVLSTVKDALSYSSSADLQSVTDLLFDLCKPLSGLLQSVNSLICGDFTSTITPLISNNVGVLAQLNNPSNFDFLGDLIGKATSATCSPYMAKGIIDDAMNQVQPLLQTIGSLQANDITTANPGPVVAEVNTVPSAAYNKVQASINANTSGSGDVSAADVVGVTARLVNPPHSVSAGSFDFLGQYNVQDLSGNM
uniref:Uncharacterized protein n=1 Tax=Moniliophthora roreri TaxID=221103 RepID=A0A0W0EZ02_MONRR